jgi:hypothetical protein
MTVSAGPFVVTAFGLTGSNGVGPVSAPGVKVGDKVIWILITSSGGATSHQNPNDFMEAVVSVADEIQQRDSSNLSTYTVDVILVRNP